MHSAPDDVRKMSWSIEEPSVTRENAILSVAKTVQSQSLSEVVMEISCTATNFEKEAEAQVVVCGADWSSMMLAAASCAPSAAHSATPTTRW